MKKHVLWALAVVGLFLTSCTTLKRTATTAPVVNNVQQYPTVADLVVLPKTENTMQWSFRPFHLGEPKLSVAKGNLVAETLKQQQADVLLEPQFIFKRTSYGQRVLTVTGYPAQYKQFRKATPEDLKALEATKNAGSGNERTVYKGEQNLFGIFTKGK